MFLRYLVEHADRLVTQEEILEALWPATYVNPEVVKKYVLGIRKVLGDQTSKPAFVATFPRRGYQFIAPVREETNRPLSGISKSGIKTIVGREDAMAQLEQALDKALNGQRQIVFITGEAGIGKTTLVDVFHQSAAFSANCGSPADSASKASAEKKPTTRCWKLSGNCCETRMTTRWSRTSRSKRPHG